MASLQKKMNEALSQCAGNLNSMLIPLNYIKWGNKHNVSQVEVANKPMSQWSSHNFNRCTDKKEERDTQKKAHVTSKG